MFFLSVRSSNDRLKRQILKDKIKISPDSTRRNQPAFNVAVKFESRQCSVDETCVSVPYFSDTLIHDLQHPFQSFFNHKGI